jgi:vacuolar-type H+-ATPase subunit C/Vma6
MTFAEWRDSPLRSASEGETDEMLSKIWAKYDIDNVGYLTKEEAINRKPAA